ncbi:hypothetical protein [Hymenobacter volaticus]|uniref:Glycerophosphoryl diester phosphodiesterase membrane domain-containing protein n=1 Tax=Hymenobacter volaticus TaxID=2932254 RepID=A0ABY4G364_9BACT|nr:hypothetical protein [Hymenobacter volaticus]UOQ65227.1 hypothetical protein MUN86_16940 [Hymenobacter volaticus]
MQLKFTKEEDFRQERDFGAKIGATFEFIGAHWRPLGKCLAYFVIPAALLMGLAMGVSQSHVLGSMQQPDTISSAERIRSFNSNIFSVYYWLGILSSFISYLLLGATVYGYVLVRLSLPAEQEVTPRLVGEQISRFAARLLLSGIAMGILIALGSVLLVVPGMYLAIGLSFVWTVQVLENNSVSQGISRSLYLIKGYWWSTFGLMFIMSIILGLLAMIFQVPYLFTFVGKLLHWSFVSSDVLMVASTMLASVGQMFLYSMLFIALLFQYFNLVEKKEGLGMRNLVASLGSGRAPVAYNSTFRPDDEGEY